MAWTVRRRTHRDQEKMASEEGMPRVRDLNFRWTGVTWVLEQGIELMDRCSMCHPSYKSVFHRSQHTSEAGEQPASLRRLENRYDMMRAIYLNTNREYIAWLTRII